MLRVEVYIGIAGECNIHLRDCAIAGFYVPVPERGRLFCDFQKPVLRRECYAFNMTLPIASTLAAHCISVYQTNICV